MTVLFRVPGNFNNPSLPIYARDPILTNGSLVLFEPAHPSSLVNGIPANGALLPNIAYPQAKGLSVAALPNEVPWLLEGNIVANNHIWRTPKGGYIIESPSNGVGGAAALFPGWAVDHIIDTYDTHKFYVGIWGGFTPQSTSTNGGRLVNLSDDSTPNASPFNAMLLLQVGNNISAAMGTPYTSSELGIKRIAAVPEKVGSAVKTGERTRAQTKAGARLMGNAPTSEGNSVPLASASLEPRRFCFYRAYVEDLTISGRSGSDVAAIDQTLFAQHVLTSGGRYYQDVFTKPV